MKEGKFITIKGAIDVHCHAGFPSADDRPFNDILVAQQAAAAGMEAIVFKSHYESTVARAFYVNQAVPNIKLFGAMALNRYVGGLNPLAAENLLVSGGKEIFMPGIDAARHIEVYGGAGVYEIDGKVTGPSTRMSKRAFTGLRVMENGKLKEEVIEIVKLVAKHDAFFTSGHLYKEEIFELARLAKKEGAKMLIDHPFMEAPGWTYDEVDQLKELTKLGAYISFNAALTMPAERVTTPQQDKKCIEAIGPEKVVIVSDAGSAPYPMAHETLRTYAQNLHDVGVSVESLETMMIKNPRKLLSL